MRRFACLAGAAVALFSAGCVITGDDDGSSTSTGPKPDPIGPVASNADEAWPDKGAQPDSLTRDDIAKACVALVGCSVTPEQVGSKEALLGMDICVAGVAWTAERAIPMSHLFMGLREERAENFVRCALDNAADCSAVELCLTTRTVSLYCEEDGCRVSEGSPYTVQCESDIASMTRDGMTTTRDCNRASAKCDTKSVTGCTDRHFTACAPEHIGKPGRCEGNLLIGCDSGNQVSYRDCERMSGTCGVTDSGVDACLYGTEDPACTADPPASAVCTGSNITACVNKQRITVPAASLCGG